MGERLFAFALSFYQSIDVFVMKSRRADSIRLPLLAGGALQAYVSCEDDLSD